MVIKEKSLRNIHIAIFLVSSLSLLMALPILLTGFGLNLSTSQEMQIGKYGEIIIPTLFSAIASISMLLKADKTSIGSTAISLVKPLLGAIVYALLVTLYFYEQIIGGANLMNALTEPFGIHSAAGHIFKWRDTDLFEVRFTQTLISTWLVFYGFFTAMIGVKQIPLRMVLFTVLLLLIVLIFLNKVLAIRLHSPWGHSLHMLLLFIIPFVAIKFTLRKS